MVSKSSINVLLVEENEDHAILISNSFFKYGEKYNLISADSLKKAFEYFDDKTDIIVTNLYLPDGSGIEFLKNKSICDDIPVIVLESYVDQETVVKLLKSGIFDYVGKSADIFDSLPEKIDKYIQLRDLKRERRRISEQQNMLSIAIKHSSEVILVTDEKGIIEFVNPAFEKTTGYSADEVVGKSPSILKSGQHDKNFYDGLWKTIKSGKPWKGHLINKRKDGSIFEEDASISPVFGEKGVITNYVALKRDISELINIENQLRHAQKMEGIGTLAAGIAHEINTPLQYLNDNTLFIKESFKAMCEAISEIKKIAAEKDADNMGSKLNDIIRKNKLEYLVDEIPNALDENLNGIKIVRKIVTAMKNFSHPGLKTMQKADINEAIKSTITITKNVWKYNAEIVTDLMDKLPEVSCHIGDINQVFLNMITNSCDAIAEKSKDDKGTIRISTSCDNSYVYITIEDNGNGIPKDIKDKIFQPFFTTKQVGKGTGQGLALSYDIIVNKHNGEIKVESEPGTGTKFTIKLPVEPNE